MKERETDSQKHTLADSGPLIPDPEHQSETHQSKTGKQERRTELATTGNGRSP